MKPLQSAHTFIKNAFVLVVIRIINGIIVLDNIKKWGVRPASFVKDQFTYYYYYYVGS